MSQLKSSAPAATIRLTMAQALVRYLDALRIQTPEGVVPLFGGVFSIFGHGNVAGIGEALYQVRETLPTYRAHNEQAMAHTAIAYAKAHMRHRMMAVTSSIGPGATNLLTAAALAHVNRLPVLLLPGDVFVSRRPDPVLQQLENFQDAGISANDAFKPLSRFFDRICYPEQLLSALPRAIQVLTDPAQCGPVTLALPQDVQTMAFDYPLAFFSPKTIVLRAQAPAQEELQDALALLRDARQPLIVAGGGALYGDATEALRRFAELHGIPVAETQAGKGALPWSHPLQLGAIGVTGSPAANAMAAQADVVIAVGSRLQDFTTGSHTLFSQARLLSINVNPVDAMKWHATTLLSDARLGLNTLSQALGDWRSDNGWQARAHDLADGWRARVAQITGCTDIGASLPYDGEVIGAVQRSSVDSAVNDIVVCAAGTLPAELHKLWRAGRPGAYHVEYGYSCMGYEIAGGLGAKMAHPERDVIVMVGDGSYLMMNSEIATSVMLDQKLIIIVLDNRGYGCINRLQQACGGAPFNNMLEDCLQGPLGAPQIDFAAHARALGALAENVKTIAGLEAALQKARAADRTYLICIDTDATRTTADGGCWWEVAVPEVSTRPQVQQARADYEQQRQSQSV
ncbi:3D-(3,5/4)-trihydroxycyclohexane-1,2-dione acylhydrolase (decyclizing) [Herbaspirillum sp. Sphag1AN]|uniref:3D-(3,5/4)-trihydroxycyclohexane-1,2-dione acylhydrolase (decyclizing) n=1 Tax=unclassified Herbaspirillum TaxID=2624150 RepID=UPI00161CB643|nr:MULTISPECIES: 3D-(3,5/4)-trihydroxycyclohexane-1,2-dione acylhydrolase (decyclizing) [unclassified Herbaspirillum]MBB3212362.1 3D-(3,5/4)-trihydroxycyclohexane-1,2-dione acylhydrolase (decyclizing) [Herbaspirillum sp. Sphag1AN]MBB3245539.1 3D-(3,5/4)-trihydroxycyclohexane-1,2-dione acylhydrolase (decyclizing) [Herbaspirillum sp. Sphag64]